MAYKVTIEYEIDFSAQLEDLEIVLDDA